MFLVLPSTLHLADPDAQGEAAEGGFILGDGAGYDIRSYDARGRERLLEVKTTTGTRTTPFFISENEFSFSNERPDAFRLVRLYQFGHEPGGFELRPPLDKSVNLKPTNYRASF